MVWGGNVCRLSYSSIRVVDNHSRLARLSPRRARSSAGAPTLYAARYLSLDFVSLVEQLEQIEQSLATDAYMSVNNALVSDPGQVRGDVLYLNGRYYRPIVTLERPSRTLSVDIRCLAEARPVARSEHQIKQFGLVHKLQITIDKDLSAKTGDIVGALQLLYMTAYISLERAYVASYTKWISELFIDIYALIDAQLEILQHPELCDRFWFSVTAMGEGTFRYHFSVENLRHAISWLKEHQNAVLSPAEAVTMLLIQDVPDGVLGAPKPKSIVMYDTHTRIIEFAALPTLGTQTSYWLAERSLFASNSLTALQVTIIEEQAFEINFPVENLPVMSETVTTVKDDLVNIVTERYSNFRKEQRRLRRAITRLQYASGNIGKKAKDIGIELTAKVISDLISG